MVNYVFMLNCIFLCYFTYTIMCVTQWISYRSSGPTSFGFASLEQGPHSAVSPGEYIVPVSPPDSNHSNTSLRNELQVNF